MQTNKQLYPIKIINGYYKSRKVTGIFQTPFLKVIPTTYPHNNQTHNMVHIIDCGSFRGNENKGNIVRVRLEEDSVVDFNPNTDNQESTNTIMSYIHKEPIKNASLTFSEPEVEESEEEALNRIRKRFKAMDKLADGVTGGAIRSLIVTGAPGVGKSFGIEKALEAKHKLQGFKYEVIKGYMTPVILFQKLYEYREPKDILVFDDCDRVLQDNISLNLLKAALDSGDVREITWGTSNTKMEKDGIPTKFEFCGSVIFISNLDFEDRKSGDLKDHLEALLDRSHFLDLTIKTTRDKFLRIKQVVYDTPILDERGFSEKQKDAIVDFLKRNLNSLRDINLRQVKKIADLAFFDPEDWEEMALITLTKINK